MTDPADKRPFSYVKHLREIRDRINKELEHMTAEEAYQWHLSQEIKSATLRRLMSGARPPKPPRSQHGTARALGLLPYPKYRPSGVEWLGEVPEHWEVRRLKSVARRPIENGLGEAAIHDDRDWPRYIRITDIASSRKLRVDTFKSLPPAIAAKATVEAHDILFAAVGATFGKSYYHASQETPSACYAGYLVRFSPDVNQVLSAFVAYWAESHAYWALIRSRVVQATIENFSASRYKSLSVPVPPLSEQRTIAKYLDRETTKTDTLIGKKEVMVKGLEEYRTALISRTVTRGLPPNEARKAGLDPHPKLKPSGVEWLGEVPEHWEVAALRRITASIRASNVDKHVRNNEIPVTLCNYVDVYHNDCIDSQIDFVPGTATERQIKHFQLYVGDVLITKDSEVATDIGVPSLVVERVPDLVAAYHLTLIRPNVQRLVGPYLFRALQSDVASLQFTHGAQGVTRYGLTYASIKSVRLPVPPLSEQRAIAKYLDRETAKIDRATDLARQEIDLLHEYRTRLISDVVTGKVDVRGIGSTDPEPDSRSPEVQPNHQPGFSTPPRVGKQSPERNRGRSP